MGSAAAIESPRIDSNQSETFPDQNYFAYLRNTPRPFPLFVCGHYPAGTVAQPHSHPYLALHGCLEGPLTLQTEEGNQALDEGVFYLIPPGLRHNWRNDGPYTGVVMALLIDTNSPGLWPVESGLDTCCRELAQLVTRLHRFSVSGDAELQHSFWSAADHLTSQGAYEPLITTGILLTLLGQIHTRLASSPRAIAPPTDIARQIHRLLLNRIQHKLDIPQIAATMGISPTHAKREFHQAYGCGIMSYFNHLKIVQAKRLLCDPQLSIEQISNRLGFANPSYFSRVFTQYTSQTPSNFRRSADAP